MNFKTKHFIISKTYEEKDGSYDLIYNPIKLFGEYDTKEIAKEKIEKIREYYEDEQGYGVFSYKDGEQLKIMTLEGFTEVKIVEL